jgi:hypothetical protein
VGGNIRSLGSSSLHFSMSCRRRWLRSPPITLRLQPLTSPVTPITSATRIPATISVVRRPVPLGPSAPIPIPEITIIEPPVTQARRLPKFRSDSRFAAEIASCEDVIDWFKFLLIVCIASSNPSASTLDSAVSSVIQLLSQMSHNRKVCCVKGY